MPPHLAAPVEYMSGSLCRCQDNLWSGLSPSTFAWVLGLKLSITLGWQVPLPAESSFQSSLLLILFFSELFNFMCVGGLPERMSV